MCNDGKNIEIIDNFTGNKLWVRARVMDVNFRATFYYSLDGKTFIPIGNDLNMGLGWSGQPIALLYLILPEIKPVKTDMPTLTGFALPINKNQLLG